MTFLHHTPSLMQWSYSGDGKQWAVNDAKSSLASRLSTLVELLLVYAGYAVTTAVLITRNPENEEYSGAIFLLSPAIRSRI